MLRQLTKTSGETIAFARQLRISGNPAKKYLWRKLRRKQFLGLRFRRQIPFGPYILDFLCVEKKLVIEIDGDSHHEQNAHHKDEIRDAYLKRCGFNILRFGHKEILKNIGGVFERIRTVLELEYQ